MKRLLIISLWLAGFNSYASHWSLGGSSTHYRPAGLATVGFSGGYSGRYLGSGHWDYSRPRQDINMADWSEQKLESDFKSQIALSSFGTSSSGIIDVLPKLSRAPDNLPVVEAVLMHLSGATAADLSQINFDQKKLLILTSLDIDNVYLPGFDLVIKLVGQMKNQMKKLNDQFNSADTACVGGHSILARLNAVRDRLLSSLRIANDEVQLRQSEVRARQADIVRLEHDIADLTQQLANREGGMTQELQDEIAQVRAEGHRYFDFDIQSARSLNHDRRRQLQEAEIVFRNRLKPHQDRLAEFQAKLAMSRPEDPERVALTKELNELLKLDPQSIDGKNNLAAVRKAIEKYDLNHSKYIFPMIDDEGLSKWRIALIQFGERYVPAVHKVADQVTEAVIIPAVSEADDFGGFLESKFVSPISADTTYPISPVSAILSDYEDPYGEYTLPDDLETKGEPAVLQDSKDEDFISANASPTLAVGFAQASPVLAAGFAEALPSHRAGGPACDIVVPANLVEFASNLGVSAMNGYLKANPNDLIGTLSRSEMDKRMLEVRAIIQRVDAYAAHNNGRTLLGLNRGDVERWRTYLNSSC